MPVSLVGKGINVNKVCVLQYTFSTVVSYAPLPFGAVATAIIGLYKCCEILKYQRPASRPRGQSVSVTFF